MQIIELIIIGITLSLDAFSIAFALGLSNISLKNKNILTISIGIFHFIMPLLGKIIGNTVLSFLFIEVKYILIIVFVLIIIEIIKSFKEEENVVIENTIGYIILAFMVAIDSFSIGLGLSYITDKYILSAIIFMLCSFIFTWCALILSKIISKKVGSYSKILEIIILFTLIIYYLCK